jgi:general secretion pathway protein J
MKKTTGARGFTLIELLIAISILAIIAVLGWRGLDAIVRSRVALTQQLEETRGMQLTFAQMQSDCANVAPLTVIGSRPQLLADGERLRLVRMVYADDQPSRLQVVVYRLNNGVLSRRESQPTRDLKQLDNLWSTTAEDTDGDSAAPVILQRGVTDMSMRMWLGNGPWRSDATPTTTQVNPPPGQTTNPNALRGLEVTLKTESTPSPLLKVFLIGPT